MRIIYNGTIEEFDRIEYKEVKCLVYDTSNQWYALYCSKNGKMTMLTVVNGEDLHYLKHEGHLTIVEGRFVYIPDSDRFFQEWKIIESADTCIYY